MLARAFRRVVQLRPTKFLQPTQIHISSRNAHAKPGKERELINHGYLMLYLNYPEGTFDQNVKIVTAVARALEQIPLPPSINFNNLSKPHSCIVERIKKQTAKELSFREAMVPTRQGVSNGKNISHIEDPLEVVDAILNDNDNRMPPEPGNEAMDAFPGIFYWDELPPKSSKKLNWARSQIMARDINAQEINGYTQINTAGRSSTWGKFVNRCGSERLWVKFFLDDGKVFPFIKAYSTDVNDYRPTDGHTLRLAHAKEAYQRYPELEGKNFVLHHEAELRWDSVRNEAFVVAALVPRSLHGSIGHFGGVHYLVLFNERLGGRKSTKRLFDKFIDDMRNNKV